MKTSIYFAFAVTMLAGASVFAGSPAAPYDNTRIDARLNVAVKDDTKVVHFVRDNADPNVITKAYVLKHTDPYELRSYLRSIVQTRKVTDNNTNVEAIKYSDGTSMILISAEDYRFNDTPNAQGFDSIVKELDKPKLVSSSGRQTYIYSPKFRAAGELREMISNVGLYNANVAMNNVGGTDVVVEDPDLNLVFFTTAPFSRRTIMELLNKYDRPYPAVRAKVTVYELYAENDTKLGLDFQAWKNNDGLDFFTAGGRFSQNHVGQELIRGAKWNDASYFQFNPKWNTKYIDFLTTKGKAKVLHTSEITLHNNTPGVINKTTQLFLAQKVADEEGKFQNFATAYESVVFDGVIGVDDRGRTIKNAGTSVSLLVLGKPGNHKFVARQNDKTAKFNDENDEPIAGKVTLVSLDPFFAETLYALNYQLGHKGNRTIEVNPSDSFGFKLEMTPSISTKATALNVKISNSSLIGYTSAGTPRIQQGAKIDTNFMIANGGSKLVIGGIEKRSVMRVSGGVPLLKDLPLIGWIFSTETEATKRSQLLVVAEIVPEAMDADTKAVIEKVKKDLTDAGSGNSYGYRQYLIDKDRM